jgi:hypothetical protein
LKEEAGENVVMATLSRPWHWHQHIYIYIYILYYYRNGNQVEEYWKELSK